MLNNLDIYLVKNSLTRNLKAQLEEATHESLTPINPRQPHQNASHTQPDWQPLLGVWSNGDKLGKPEQS